MNRELILTIFCCASILGFCEEDKIISLEEISLTVVESPKENEPPKEMLQQGTITIQTQHSPPEKLAYPIEEANFEEIFGIKR